MTVPIWGGKPLKFKTPDDLAKVIGEYFENTPREEWAVTGVSLAVGSKQLLNDYEARPDYKHLVQRAKLMVENKYELALNGSSNAAGPIFALKNMGWRDQQYSEVSVLTSDKMTKAMSRIDGLQAEGSDE